MTESGSRIRLLDVPVDPIGMQQTLDWVAERIASGEHGTHLCVNAANVVRAHADPEYRELLERTTVIGADGQPMVWASRLLGRGLPERVAGIDLMERVLDTAVERGWRVFLLGARSEVVQRLADQLRARGIEIVGAHDGYFDTEDAEDLIEEIRRSGADVLFVGMPTPTKERFIVERTGKAGVPVCIGVGGSFDVLVGDLRRAPKLMQRLGLEWLFRLFQEPRRLFVRYAVTNTRFVALLLKAMVQRGRDTGRS